MRKPYSLLRKKLKNRFFYFLLICSINHVTVAQTCPAPADFNLITPCYVNGSRAANPNEDVLVLFNHATARGESATKQVIASYSEVGTVWGLAYHAQSKKLYAAAFLKRHSDLSPDGLGAIYVIDLTTPTTAGAGTPTLWMNLNSAAHLGAGATLFPTETAGNRGLAGINTPSRDAWAYNLVGKEGLGDIEISADGTKMFVMDLTNRQVLEINIATQTVTNRYPVDAPANYANAADRRPFGIKHYNGELYIGVVSSGETGEVDANLRGTIMKLSGSTFTSVLDMPTWNYRDCCNDPRYVGWNNYSTLDMANGASETNPYAYIQNPVPLISDIEFDNAGNLVIGVMDWSAHRFGAFNYRPFPTPTSGSSLYNIQVHGDVIKANKSGSSWVLESDIGNFYNDMRARPQDGDTWPIETFMGGMIISDCNGTELVVANIQDPTQLNQGGSVWMKTSDGLMQTNTGVLPANKQSSAAAQTIIDGSRLQIYRSADGQPSTFGKAAGLGDLVGTYISACVKPDAGPDQTLNCNGTTAPTTTTLVPVTTGGTWSNQTGNPATATFVGNNVSAMTTSGTYKFIYTKDGCTDTVKVIVPNCTPGIDPICFSSSRVVTDNKLGAVCNPPVTPDLFYSFFMIFKNNSGTYDRFKTTDLKFEEYCDGTAKIYGSVCSVTNPDLCLDIVYNMTGRTVTPPAGSPYAGFCNAPTGAYYYYTGGTGTLTGKSGGGFNNFSATLVRDGAAFQIGIGANTNENVLGASGWIKPTIVDDGDGNWTIEVEPTSGVAHGDFNFNLTTPTPLYKIVPTNATACEGGSATMSANLNEKCTVTYTWVGPGGFTGTGPSITINPVTAAKAGNYTVTAQITSASGATCQKDTTVTLTITPKPNAGTDKSLACADPVAGTLQTTTTLIGFSPAGGTWAAQTGNPAAAAVTNAGAVTGMTVAGTYKFIYTSNTCSDTVAVTVEPCSGCVKPNAGNDQSICAPATTATLTGFAPSGGTWAAQAGNPATAAVTNAGSVTGITANGTYKFIYSVTQGGQTCTDTVQIIRNEKPTVGDAAICAPATTASVTRSPAGGNWVADAANPAAATISAAGAVSGLTVNGTYKFIYTLNGCSDTATVVRNAKPNAGADKALACADPVAGTLQTTTILTGFSPAGGTWAAQTGNPAAAAVTNAGAVTGMTVAGTYKFIYTVSDCSDTVAVTVEPCSGCVKPNAGSDQSICAPATTATLTGFAPSGGTWAAQTGNPATAAVTNAGSVTGITANGTYKFIYSVTQGGQTCTDTVQIIRNEKPTVGDAAICAPATTASVTRSPAGGNWVADAANPAAATISAAGAVSGLTVNGTYKFIYTLNGCSDTATVVRNAKPNAGADKSLACADPVAGTLQTTTNLTGFSPAGGTWAAQTGNPAAAAVTNAGAVTGMTVAGTYKFIYTVSDCSDTVAVTVEPCTTPCVKPKWTVTTAPTCAANLQTYSVSFSVTGKNGIIKASVGTLTNPSVNNYTVTGIPNATNLKITDSLSAVCKFDTTITGPNCNCTPKEPTLLNNSFTVCAGDTFPTLKATVVGLATVEWFTQATGGTAVATGLNYKPAGTVPALGDTLYAQARSTDPTCPAAISTARVPAFINAQNCAVEIDLALKKMINKKIAQIGDELTYTLKVFNQLNVAATGVEVTDSIATSVQFVAGSFVASRGNATITGNVIKWTIGGIAANAGANGDTVTLTYRVKATQEGVHFNTAEICKTNEKDVDSTPCNHDDNEDDIDRQCFTVPIKLCPSQKVQASIPNTYTNVQWYKNGSSTPIASGNEVLLSDIGVYTYTATNQTCPAEGCCPIIIEAGVNCCPVEVCVPFTVKKMKK